MITAREAQDYARKYYFERIMDAAQGGKTSVTFGLDLFPFIEAIQGKGYRVECITEPEDPLKMTKEQLEKFEPFYRVRW